MAERPQRVSADQPACLVPPPVTTIAWRLSHLTEMLALRAEYSSGARALLRDLYRAGFSTSA